MKNFIFFFIITSFFFNSCTKHQENKTNEKVFDVTIDLEDEFLNIESTKQKDHALNGDYYSSVDSIKIYGAGYSKKIVDSLKNNNLEVIISAWLRESKTPNEGVIAFSLNGINGEIKDWKTIAVQPDKFSPSIWCKLQDTIRYDANTVSSANLLKIFGMKQNGSDSLDIDDVKIKFRFYK